MLLKQLLKNLDYTLVQGCLNTEVTDIYYDSRKVTPGGLFVCIVGTQRDSHAFAATITPRTLPPKAPPYWPSSTICPPRCWPLCRM